MSLSTLIPMSLFILILMSVYTLILILIKQHYVPVYPDLHLHKATPALSIDKANDLAAIMRGDLQTPDFLIDIDTLVDVALNWSCAEVRSLSSSLD